MVKIFSIIGKDPSQPLTIEEFVESYVYFEEQLKIKIKKIEKYLDDLTNQKESLNEMKIVLISFLNIIQSLTETDIKYIKNLSDIKNQLN